MFNEFFSYADMDLGLDGDIYNDCILKKDFCGYAKDTKVYSISTNGNVLEFWNEDGKIFARFNILIDLEEIKNG